MARKRVSPPPPSFTVSRMNAISLWHNVYPPICVYTRSQPRGIGQNGAVLACMLFLHYVMLTSRLAERILLYYTGSTLINLILIIQCSRQLIFTWQTRVIRNHVGYQPGFQLLKNDPPGRCVCMYIAYIASPRNGQYLLCSPQYL